MTSFKKSASLKVSIAFTDHTGSALSISGATVKFMMKSREGDADGSALVSKQTGSGITITDGAGGLAEVTISATELDSITDKTVYCEAMAINGSQVVRTDTYTFVVKTNIIKATS